VVGGVIRRWEQVAVRSDSGASDKLRKKLAEAAKERKAAGQERGRKSQKGLVKNSSPTKPAKTRDEIGKAFGISGDSVDKGHHVIVVTTWPSTSGDLDLHQQARPRQFPPRPCAGLPGRGCRRGACATIVGIEIGRWIRTRGRADPTRRRSCRAGRETSGGVDRPFHHVDVHLHLAGVVTVAILEITSTIVGAWRSRSPPSWAPCPRRRHHLAGDRPPPATSPACPGPTTPSLPSVRSHPGMIGRSSRSGFLGHPGASQTGCQ